MKKTREKGVLSLGEEKQGGYTMIVVLCLMALFMAMILAILFSSGLLIQRALTANTKEECRLSAVTYAQLLDKQLEDDESNICKYIQDSFESDWRNYDPEKPGYGEVFAVKNFSVNILESNTRKSLNENLGNITISMYWESMEEKVTDTSERDLVVTVTSTKVNEKYSITSRYHKSESTTILDASWIRWGRE